MNDIKTSLKNKKNIIIIVFIVILSFAILLIAMLKHEAEKIKYEISHYGEATYLIKSKLENKTLYIDAIGPIATEYLAFIIRDENSSDRYPVEIKVQDKDGITLGSTLLPVKSIGVSRNQNITFSAQIPNISWVKRLKGISINGSIAGLFVLRPYIDNDLTNLCWINSKKPQVPIENIEALAKKIEKQQPKDENEFHELLKNYNKLSYAKYFYYCKECKVKYRLSDYFYKTYPDSIFRDDNYSERFLPGNKEYCLINGYSRQSLVDDIKVFNSIGIKSKNDLDEAIKDWDYSNRESKWVKKIESNSKTYGNSIYSPNRFYEYSYTIFDYDKDLKIVFPKFAQDKKLRNLIYKRCKQNFKNLKKRCSDPYCHLNKCEDCFGELNESLSGQNIEDLYCKKP